MNHLKIRQLFKDFFSTHSHQWVKSFPLVPQKDPSLLFVNAGMNPFKNIFLGIESASNPNLASIQKCIRVGGKHNDLNEVGSSPSHHTFFEMMGNFSFGGYSKEKACKLALDFLTEELKLPQKNLGVSVFEKDQKTAEIWKKLGFPKERIFFYGEEDNFWRMGDEGPCGPCSEIYFDFKEFRQGNKNMIEIWNLVFMEYHEDQNKNQKTLQKKCIDTGMGLERILSLVQNKDSNFHTDLFEPLLNLLSSLTKTPYEFISPDKEKGSVLKNNRILRILADHIRASCFLMGDKVYPSNEGRGYVLRRMIRRALYEQSQITDQKQILSKGAQEVIQNYSSVYPELLQNKETVLNFLNQEEEKFFQTLAQGNLLLEKELYSLKKSQNPVLSAEASFKLYDTYGFPFDLVEVVCQKQNIRVDSQGCHRLMEESRQKSRSKKAFSTQKKMYPSLENKKIPSTKFTGYETLEESSKILLLFDRQNQSVKKLKAPAQGLMVLDSSCFYAEGGGQTADQGVFKTQNAEGVIQDCQNIQDVFFHTFQLQSGELKEGDMCQLKVDLEKRSQTALHHSAAHLLHSALRELLGTQVEQAGSFVSFDRTRFDFTFPRKLNEDEIFQIESLVNQKILEGLKVDVHLKEYEEALKDGALSFFEKPQNKRVRVLKMGDFSHELCGGTHVKNTSQILYFKIISESSVGSGIRRIEAVCGKKALELISYLSRENLKARKLLNLPLPDLPSKQYSLIEHIEKQKNKIRELKKSKPAQKRSENFSVEAIEIENKKGVFLCSTYPEEMSDLISVVDQIKKRYVLGVVVVTGELEQKNPIVVAFPEVISKKILPSTLIQKLGGKGGGPQLFAKGILNQGFSQKDLRKKVLNLLQKEGFLKELN